MRNYSKKLTLAILIGGASLALAQSASDFQGQRLGGGDQQTYGAGQRYVQGINIPHDTSGAPRPVVRNRFEMDTPERARLYKEIQERKYERRRILGEVFDAAILMRPVVRVIRPVDTIGVSPTYITQIVFPKGMKITDAKSSFTAPVLEYGENLLRFRPDPRSFFTGNIVLALTDGRKNYAMTIFVNRYYQEDCRIDMQNQQYICRRKRAFAKPGSYAYSYNNLSAYYKYINPVKLDDLEAITKYEQTTGETLDLKHNGDVVSFIYDGIAYDIVRDDNFGNVDYRGKKYRVDVGGL